MRNAGGGQGQNRTADTGNVGPLIAVPVPTSIGPHPLSDIRCSTFVAERQFAHRELFLNTMDASQLHQLREALTQELVLGREEFKYKIERMTQRQVRRGKDGRPRVEDILGEYDVIVPSILEYSGI